MLRKAVAAEDQRADAIGQQHQPDQPYRALGQRHSVGPVSGRHSLVPASGGVGGLPGHPRSVHLVVRTLPMTGVRFSPATYLRSLGPPTMRASPDWPSAGLKASWTWGIP